MVIAMKTAKTYVYYVLALLLVGGGVVFASSNPDKLLSKTRWTLSKSLDKLSTEDTITFNKVKKDGLLHFKSNGTLKQHQTYLRCGNKFFMDYFTPKPPEWKVLGSWKVHNVGGDKKLMLNLKDKTIHLTVLTEKKEQLKFRVDEIADKGE